MSGKWHDLFFHRRVFRAGWGLLLFVLLTVLLVVGQTVALRTVPRLRDVPHTILVPHDALGNIVALFAVAVATAVATMLEQRRYGDYGFGGTTRLPLLLAGIASGAAILTGFMLALRAMGLVALHANNISKTADYWRQGAIWAGFYLLVGFVEELLLRGYLQFDLTRAIASLLRTYFGARSGVKIAFWSAATLLSLIYGLLHGLNAGETLLGMVSTAFLGLLLVFSLWRTGSLWWALGFHVAWDWTQSFVFGTADTGLSARDHIWLAEPLGPAWKSGGSAGPEGSVFIFGALLAALCLVLLLPRHVVYPDLWTEAELDAPEPDPDTVPDPDRAV
jgi:membrane protease YdiL (CAAX protease family)